MLVISISGLGTYAFKGLLADIKAQVAKVKAEVFKEFEIHYKMVKAEIFKELENYYNEKVKTEFEEMKNSVKEELKRTTDFICAKEKIKTQEILREHLRLMKLEKPNE
ncbi:hypothetical protein QIA36_07070 (plasmid) [Borreliella yangtzensis]|uniref:hypothetical protein n=1 Tax=Borreliella yangtzensis TaxID=683292 RepID=UPI003BA27474